MPKDLKYDSTRIFQRFCSVFELWAQSLGSRRMITITRTLVLPIKHFQAAGITTRTLVLPIEHFQAAGSNSVLQLHESVVWDLVVRVKDRTPLLRHISAHRRPAPSFTCVYCCTMMTTFSHRQHATSHKWLHSAPDSMPQATNYTREQPSEQTWHSFANSRHIEWVNKAAWIISSSCYKKNRVNQRI